MKFPRQNPFKQIPACWQVAFTVPRDFAIAFEESLSDIALSTASFEDPANEMQWQVTILCDHDPDMDDIRARLAILAEACGTGVPPLEITALEQRDWLAAVAQDFPPMRIGRFYVHGSHVTGQTPAGLFPVQVEAGMAFGSGEHATTSGCLKAITALAKRRYFKRVLDMGCGSAILAIAAARIWKTARVLGTDIDPVSVRIASDNARINRVKDRVRCYTANGYAPAFVGKRGAYELILSNILARPLVKFAPSLARSLAPGGIAVLSGLLATQERMVLAAHLAQGLRLKERIVQQGWSTLVLQK